MAHGKCNNFHRERCCSCRPGKQKCLGQDDRLLITLCRSGPDRNDLIFTRSVGKHTPLGPLSDWSSISRNGFASGADLINTTADEDLFRGAPFVPPLHRCIHFSAIRSKFPNTINCPGLGYAGSTATTAAEEEEAVDDAPRRRVKGSRRAAT